MKMEKSRIKLLVELVVIILALILSAQLTQTGTSEGLLPLIILSVSIIALAIITQFIIDNDRIYRIVLMFAISILFLVAGYIVYPELFSGESGFASLYAIIIAIVMVFCYLIFPMLKRNTIVGLRTGGTLSDEGNWRAAHDKLASFASIFLLASTIIAFINMQNWLKVVLSSMVIVLYLVIYNLLNKKTK
ncbi:MAG: SdpI family protein [Ezakiella sp.]|nr:SdpI family protein [Ezakiella sp.]